MPPIALFMQKKKRDQKLTWLSCLGQQGCPKGVDDDLDLDG